MKALRVRYQGRDVGRLAEIVAGSRTYLGFEYDPSFLAAGEALSPFKLPLRPGVQFRDGEVPGDQLPGLFEDSLPDAWGDRIMTDWFVRQGTPAHRVTPLMKLAYVGRRGMGALEYEPGDGPDLSESVELERIAGDAERAVEVGTFSEALTVVGTSAGGAQPKALVALASPTTTNAGFSVWTGSGEIPAGFAPWLVKFTLARLVRPGLDARVEHAYARMAAAAGIDVPETRLLPAAGLVHFASRRFDRHGSERIHYHSLARLLHAVGGDLDYDTLLRVTSKLTHRHADVVEAYRRAVFNVLARNDDDHGKNHGFLYRGREWRLAPAFDVTHCPLPERGLAVCGERRHARRSQLEDLAARFDLKREAPGIIEACVAALRQWPRFAALANVPEALTAEVARDLAAH